MHSSWLFVYKYIFICFFSRLFVYFYQKSIWGYPRNINFYLFLWLPRLKLALNSNSYSQYSAKVYVDKFILLFPFSVSLNLLVQGAGEMGWGNIREFFGLLKTRRALRGVEERNYSFLSESISPPKHKAKVPPFKFYILNT